MSSRDGDNGGAGEPAEVGTVVTGLLNVDTPPAFLPTFDTTGDVLAQLPYTYTVGAPAAS